MCILICVTDQDLGSKKITINSNLNQAKLYLTEYNIFIKKPLCLIHMNNKLINDKKKYDIVLSIISFIEKKWHFFNERSDPDPILH